MQSYRRDATDLRIWTYVCAVFLLPLAASVFYLDKWSLLNVAATFALSTGSALLLIGFHDARRYWWAWRVIGLAVFAGCTGYAGDRLLSNTHSMGIYFGSLLTAGGSLLILGLPGLKAALARDLDTFLGVISPQKTAAFPAPPTDNIVPLADDPGPALAPDTHPGEKHHPAA